MVLSADIVIFALQRNIINSYCDLNKLSTKSVRSEFERNLYSNEYYLDSN